MVQLEIAAASATTTQATSCTFLNEIYLWRLENVETFIVLYEVSQKKRNKK